MEKQECFESGREQDTVELELPCRLTEVKELKCTTVDGMVATADVDTLRLVDDKPVEHMFGTPVYPVYQTKDYNYQPKDYKPKQTIMQKLTSALQRALKPELQKQYRAGFINGGLELTQQGQEELLAILSAKYEKELTERAEEIIKEAEEK